MHHTFNRKPHATTFACRIRSDRSLPPIKKSILSIQSLLYPHTRNTQVADEVSSATPAQRNSNGSRRSSIDGPIDAASADQAPPPPPPTRNHSDATMRTWRQRSRSTVANDSTTTAGAAAAAVANVAQLLSNATATAAAADAAIEYLHTDDVKQSPIIVGDLSCLKDKFRPAPTVANADIKYLR